MVNDKRIGQRAKWSNIAEPTHWLKWQQHNGFETHCTVADHWGMGWCGWFWQWKVFDTKPPHSYPPHPTTNPRPFHPSFTLKLKPLHSAHPFPPFNTPTTISFLLLLSPFHSLSQHSCHAIIQHTFTPSMCSLWCLKRKMDEWIVCDGCAVFQSPFMMKTMGESDHEHPFVPCSIPCASPIKLCECCVWFQCVSQWYSSSFSKAVPCWFDENGRVDCLWNPMCLLFFRLHNSDQVQWVLCLISMHHSVMLLLSLQCCCLLIWWEWKRVDCWWNPMCLLFFCINHSDIA